MKQRLLILAAASAVVFAACNGGNNEGSYTQAQLDSLSKVKTDSIAASLKAQNDSLINAKAAIAADSLRMADSIAHITKGGKATVIKKNTKPNKPAPPKEEPKKEEPKKPGGLRGESDQAKQQQGNGSLRNQSDQTKQQQQQRQGGSLRNQSDQAKQQTQQQ